MDDITTGLSHGETYLTKWRNPKRFRCKESYVKNFARDSQPKEPEPHSNIKGLPKRLRHKNKSYLGRAIMCSVYADMYMGDHPYRYIRLESKRALDKAVEEVREEAVIEAREEASLELALKRGVLSIVEFKRIKLDLEEEAA